MTFYSHLSGAIIILAIGGALFLIDFKYHIAHRRELLFSSLLLLICLIPFINFNLSHSTSSETQLRVIDSVWFRPNVELVDRVKESLKNYSRALSYEYWFSPEENGEIIRHRWFGRGNLPIWVLPFFLLGSLICIRKWRDPSYRVLLIAVFASVSPALLVGVGIMRIFCVVVPFTVISAIGLDSFSKLPKKVLSDWMVNSAIFVALVAVTINYTWEGIKKGPTWFSDYGLYGQQYGGSQVFGEIKSILDNPQNSCALSTSWANGIETLSEFFLPNDYLVRLRGISADEILSKKVDTPPTRTFILTTPEYEKIKENKKIKSVTVNKIIYYPDGTPGFYLLKFAYNDQIDSIFAEEKAARSKPVVGTVEIDNMTVRVEHSLLDMGTTASMFDQDILTLARGYEANPFVIDLAFPTPKNFSAIELDLGHDEYIIVAELTSTVGQPPLKLEKTFANPPPGNPKIEILVPAHKGPFVNVKLSIGELHPVEEPHIHVIEVQFKKP